ncbi:fushi tarazu-like protein [Sarcoptes scabiei]|nr:fushi tarazu-like protein [Sarcoptes scabiei]
MGHGNASDSKVSISEDKIKKILTTAKIQVPSESPKYAGSETSGTFHTSIVGRFENERARLGPNFTEKDRQWRIKFLKAQDLHPSEPFDVPELRKVHYNPIRRFYRYPLNLFEDFLTPKLGRFHATLVRKTIGNGLILYYFALFGWYQLNYNQTSWEYNKGFFTSASREAVFPGDPRYPWKDPKTESWQYYDRDFHKRKVFLDAEKI